uniref:26S proteasome non-ATPase regulatory subunit 2 homolog n=1 Tax=Pyramimonas obovata TaxID=1411642 RepID=A0A7S0WQH9_9CHLO|mmetsp:Transcript_34742/g.75960  ORF Transcript_34742/g.75960 Transcript_34742/m.75960 type:complete len:896 (+) Transcript_34742:208-2895(+)|eukprot:CAMPEP_0118935948 /NCGR_PEP_ID=MMETSP1169-20130426/15918_1 /TAXON_ID=36882 /ORGANISM="Pyramimonas obovata, Strain CCMP722" /LENGTH=895 /DNA_ID=CAMNT_0006879031 /DNA_START=180 /DNA_END=2867 /DNA_ORIENTATION=+
MTEEDKKKKVEKKSEEEKEREIVAKKKKGEIPDEMSEEDQELKDNLELMVERTQDADSGVQKLALESLRKEIRSATSSMTSVPKPLKFLRPHYDLLKELYEKMPKGENKVLLADVISLLAMTMSSSGTEIPESLKYRLLGSAEELGSWGHEYVRNLAGEIGQEYQRRQGLDESVEDLLNLARQIVPFHMKSNAEPEAVDLLIEVELMNELPTHCDKNNYARTGLYLVSCANYLPEPEDTLCLEVANQIYLQEKKFPEAMRVAMRLGSQDAVDKTFTECTDVQEKRQLAYLLARQGESVDLDSGITAVEEDADTLRELLSNAKLSENYLALARDLDVMEAKTPEDIYKSHLVEGRTPSGAAVDSARQNLATTFVNAFVNAGYGHDKLMTTATDDASVSWIFKNKEHGKMSAAASLGAILLWDVEGGLPQIDKYLYSTDNHVVAGALLSVGIVNSAIRNECDPAYALLHESVVKENASVRIGAIQGLGLAYAGTAKDEVQELLCPVVTDDSVGAEIFGFAALTLGLVFVGTAHQECAQAICNALMTRPEADLEHPLGRLAFLGLGLLFLRKQAAVEATVEIVKVLNPKVAKYAQTVLEMCAYCGSGNVLKVQQFLAACGEHIDKESEQYKNEGDAHQGVSVLGIALVAMAEDLGNGMALRAMEHLLQYGEPSIRRAVPLAIALLSMSNPEVTVTDILGRLSHDTDEEVAMGAVLSLGLVSAGTNSARVASTLRQLSSYYYKEPSLLFLLRCAQGLTHLGKGLLTLNPYHTDRLLSPVATAGLLATVFCCLDMKQTVLGKYHHVLFYLVSAMSPRMLMTLDEEGKPLPVTVRVGQAVDVVGQAGKPKTITGFQTHTTPVLLGVGDRAELATEKYLPVSPILEGCVILRPNPDYVEVEL